MRPENPTPRREELVGAGFVSKGERTTSVRPAYASSKCKAARGNADRTKLGAKAELLGEVREEGGDRRFSFSQRKARKAAEEKRLRGAAKRLRATERKNKKRCSGGAIGRKRRRNAVGGSESARRAQQQPPVRAAAKSAESAALTEMREKERRGRAPSAERTAQRGRSEPSVGFVSRKEMPRMYEEASGTKGPVYNCLVLQNRGPYYTRNFKLRASSQFITKFGYFRLPSYMRNFKLRESSRSITKFGYFRLPSYMGNFKLRPSSQINCRVALLRETRKAKAEGEENEGQHHAAQDTGEAGR